jgi:hypothetical protein
MIQIENELLGMLEYSILGNSLQNWLIALCIATITLSALYRIKRLGLSRLTALAKQTENTHLIEVNTTRYKPGRFLIMLGSVVQVHP